MWQSVIIRNQRQLRSSHSQYTVDVDEWPLHPLRLRAAERRALHVRQHHVSEHGGKNVSPDSFKDTLDKSKNTDKMDEII